MSEQSADSAGSPGAAQPLPNGDDWGEARPEGELGAKNPLVPGPPAYHGDRFFYRVVVCALAAVAVGALIGGMILAAMCKDVPDAVLALGSAAVGALAGVVAGNRNQT
jgi:hypothetical protein